MNNQTSSGTLRVLWVRIKIACFKKQSTITRMSVKLLDSGSCSIKSIEIDFQGQSRMDNYFSNLYSLWYCALFVITQPNG